MKGGLGLSGAQRVGKSTLAEAFAKKHGITFVKTSTAEVFAAIGRDPRVEYPIDERIAIQQAILYAIEKQYAAAAKLSGETFVSDRTPLDLAMYMLADIQRSTLVGFPAIAALVNNYVHECFLATNRWFSTVVLVQPGIPLIEAPGRAPACPANIEHLNAILGGLMLDQRLMCGHYMIPRRYTDLNERVASFENAVKASVDAHERTQATREAMGMLLH